MTTGLNRDTIDKYYTKKEVVDKCLDLFKENIDISENTIIIEPSAGNGSFINSIKNYTHNICDYKFYDLEPERNDIIQQDYLKLDTKQFNKYDKIHILGNPPFGRQSSTAIKFIRKSCSFCNTFSFILPLSFKKESMMKRIPLNFHLKKEFILPHYSFLVNDVEHDVPCVFQIWEKGVNLREKLEKLQPNNFKFVKKTDEVDLTIRRVGVYAGKVFINKEDKSVSSHYFIKLNSNVIAEELINKLNGIKFYCKDYSVGAKSISQQELIKEYNNIF